MTIFLLVVFRHTRFWFVCRCEARS